ncbi:CobW family GTP-binding protein [Cohnella thailandensis]|uniref:GTP-binding protein n=1 Tax=Cohnella thailandensis TaxID=557557 RepID=A0A841SLH1_9BACL|nr:GTP-binding protein [Cohnella thailandensis]MBB6633343.1 GTP-binding protein [Cohnella thailandensis]MBP1977315.1 G3E family GTPase [Cohnella thailandensis]
MTSPIPMYILSGFLGSGKTTLLRLAVDALVQSGLKPAVIINEIGDVDIDGRILERDVPRAEVLSGCVCCTVSGDVPFVVENLCKEHSPDVILLEASGVANPLSIVDSVTEASFLREVEFYRMVTVVAAPSLSAMLRNRTQGRMFRLIRDQIKAAGSIVLNQVDRVGQEELTELHLAIREWNAGASLINTEYCRGGASFLLEAKSARTENRRFSPLPILTENGHLSCSISAPGHAAHSFLKAHTYFFSKPLSRERFEAYLDTLPDPIYRAKGIVRFKEEGALSLVQYAYGQSHLSVIRPLQEVREVIVHIGQGFSEQAIEEALKKIECES